MQSILTPPPAALRERESAARAVSFTQMERLPGELQAHILSFASPESVSRVSRNTEKVVRDLRTSSHARELFLSAPTTLVGRLVQNESWINTEDGRDQLVKKVRKSAVQKIEREKSILCDDDWKKMGISRDRKTSTLSYSQMNQIDAQIKQAQKDHQLIHAFKIIKTYAPTINLSIGEFPWQSEKPSTTAKMIRDWFDNPAHREIIDSIDDISLFFLSGLPPEFLRFSNIPITELLVCAASDAHDDPETICQILDSAGPIDPKVMADALEKSITVGNQRISLMLARSGRRIDIGQFFPFDQIVESGSNELLDLILQHQQPNSYWLGLLLHHAIRHGHFDIAQLIIDSPRPLFANLSTATLNTAADLGIKTIIRSILQSPRELPYAAVDSVLFKSLENGFPEIAKEVLLSNRQILFGSFRKGFISSLQKGYSEVAQLFIESPQLSAVSLELILDHLNKCKDSQIGKNLLYSTLANFFEKRDLLKFQITLTDAEQHDSYQLGSMLLKAIRSGEPATLQMAHAIAQSGHLIDSDFLEKAFFESAEKGYMDLSQKIFHCIPTLKKPMCAFMRWAALAAYRS